METIENPFLKKGIKTITVKRRNLHYSIYHINDSSAIYTMDPETLEMFLKQAFPKLSWHLSVAFQYADHDEFWIDVKNCEYHLLDNCIFLIKPATNSCKSCHLILLKPAINS